MNVGVRERIDWGDEEWMVKGLESLIGNRWSNAIEKEVYFKYGVGGSSTADARRQTSKHHGLSHEEKKSPPREAKQQKDIDQKGIRALALSDQRIPRSPKPGALEPPAI